MKRIYVLMLMVCLLLPCALSEEMPDGMLFDVYRVRYESEVIDEFAKVVYPESEGLLFSAYGNDTDIAVSVEAKENMKNAKEFLNSYKENISGYATILYEEELGEWENPSGNEGLGVRIQYMHKRAKSETDSFVTDVFAAPLSEGKFLLCTFACASGKEAGLSDTEEEFFEGFVLEACRVSKMFMAYLKDARGEEGKTYLSIDYCSVEYDASIFTIYSVNPSKTAYEYALSEDALLWTPVISEALYSVKETPNDYEKLTGIIEEYRNAKKTDAIYRILFNEENEIIWMMHYNAF